MKKKYAQHTERSELYSKVYWGNFSAEPDKEIVENRNRFAREFDIKDTFAGSRYWKNFWFSLLGHADHTEEYVTQDGKILLVSSPYMPVAPKELFGGWEVSYPIYAQDATTVLRVFASRGAYKTDTGNLITELAERAVSRTYKGIGVALRKELTSKVRGRLRSQNSYRDRLALDILTSDKVVVV